MTTQKERDQLFNHLGYDARRLAHRHQITRAAAQSIVDEVGPDRIRLDEAARAYKMTR